MAPQVKGIETRPEGASAAFLLVHGFCAAPDEIRTFGDFLTERGIASFAVQLAGHGTTPDDLRSTRWEDWVQSAREGLEYVRSWNPDMLFIGGISMGGAISLILGSEEEGIDGLVLFAPALKIDGIMPKLVPALKYFLGDRIIDVEAAQKVYDVKRTKYDREPVSIYHELLKLQKQARKKLHLVRIPAIIIQGAKDRTISPDNGQRAFDGISSEEKELYILEDGEHVITCHYTRDEAYPVIQSFLMKHFGI